MPACNDCEEIVQNKRGAPGHERLICLEFVRSLAAVTRGAKHEAFICSVCSTEWDYLHDKKDANAGWSRC